MGSGGWRGARPRPCHVFMTHRGHINRLNGGLISPSGSVNDLPGPATGLRNDSCAGHSGNRAIRREPRTEGSEPLCPTGWQAWGRSPPSLGLRASRFPVTRGLSWTRAASTRRGSRRGGGGCSLGMVQAVGVICSTNVTVLERHAEGGTEPTVRGCFVHFCE